MGVEVHHQEGVDFEPVPDREEVKNRVRAIGTGFLVTPKEGPPVVTDSLVTAVRIMKLGSG